MKNFVFGACMAAVILGGFWAIASIDLFLRPDVQQEALSKSD